MNKKIKSGIIFIIIGVLIPLTALPFVTGWSKEKSIFDNFYSAGIKITSNEKIKAPENSPKETDKKRTLSQFMPSVIPFRYFLALTAIFIYVGIIKIDSSKREKPKEE